MSYRDEELEAAIFKYADDMMLDDLMQYVIDDLSRYYFDGEATSIEIDEFIEGVFQ